MTTYYRKNFSSGILDVALIASPGYADDPLYDEIAVEEGHTLPNSDDTTLTKEFRLVIWSDNYINPGDDPDMEIVTATRTTHSRVYQIVTRGEEDTGIVAHAVGSYVGLHYTAGVSNADLEPIQAILDADPGSILYSWVDVFGNKQIGILPAATYGKVLVTAGTGQAPFWDWVWLSPGAAYGRIKHYNPIMYSGKSTVVITIDKLRSEEAVANDYRGTNLGPLADRFQSVNPEDPDTYVDGAMAVDVIVDQTLDFIGDSYSDEVINDEEAVIGSSYTAPIVTPP
jgi:hypothetical protein